MIEPGQRGPCHKCENLLEFRRTDRETAHLMEIGQAIHYHRELEAPTTSTSRFYQCPECGQLWQMVEDSSIEETGPGGLHIYLEFLDILR
jgi:hypothetical protein